MNRHFSGKNVFYQTKRVALNGSFVFRKKIRLHHLWITGGVKLLIIGQLVLFDSTFMLICNEFITRKEFFRASLITDIKRGLGVGIAMK